MNKEHINAMMKIGLSEIEAKVYIYLLYSSPATGYKIANGIQKNPANTYQALSILEEKGYIFPEEGDKKEYRAVPYTEIFERLKKEYLSTIDESEKILSHIEHEHHINGIYNLKSIDQIDYKFQEMLKSVKTLAIIDLYPTVPKFAIPLIEDCVAKGKKVIVKTYKEINLEDVDLVIDQKVNRIDPYPGQWINLSIDFKEILISFISNKSKIYSIWSKNPVLSHSFSDGLLNEIMIDKLIYSTSSELYSEVKRIILNPRREIYHTLNIINAFKSFYEK